MLQFLLIPAAVVIAIGAGVLRPGERLATAAGAAVVESVTVQPGERRVYNLSVEGDHRYLVGEVGLVAHNVNPCPTPGTPSGNPSFTNPAQSPGPGWEWKGKGTPGSPAGNWFNPSTQESLHPDIVHPPPIGPHYDWQDSSGSWWRIFPDGRVEPK